MVIAEGLADPDALLPRDLACRQVDILEMHVELNGC